MNKQETNMTFIITRRQMLTGATLAAAAGAASGIGRSLSALASVTVGPNPHKTGGDALVVVFLRGGADGLNIVAPHGEDEYHRQRPSLALARPNDRKADPKARALDLDGFFGLHPSLSPLLPLYKNGQMGIVHAIGSGDKTRSHFEAMATMERGIASDTGAASGWLARHLDTTADPNDSPLRAVAITDTMPDSLRGATNATSLTSLADYKLAMPALMPTGSDNKTFHAPPPDKRADAVTETLRGLYAANAGSSDALQNAGRETLAALDAIRQLDPAHYKPAPGADYPKNELGNGLRQAACLIKGNIGLEVACLDMGGWDTHVAQGRDAGWQPARLADLGRALAAFAADLGTDMNHVTTVVMTEFGRRVAENSGLGTDHGRAGCLFLMGGGVVGGKVHGEWPGLAEHQLENAGGGQGDLRVTTDYRDVLAEIVSARLKNPHLAEVFPDYVPHFRHVVKPA
jgi:uncharacterized protein (DUF1501 family)